MAWQNGIYALRHSCVDAPITVTLPAFGLAVGRTGTFGEQPYLRDAACQASGPWLQQVSRAGISGAWIVQAIRTGALTTAQAAISPLARENGRADRRIGRVVPGPAAAPSRDAYPRPFANMALRVIDLDGSLTRQAHLAALVHREQADLVDLSDIAPGLRVIATRRGIEQFVGRLDSSLGAIGDKTEIVFYGSGDFHHLTAAMIARVREPVTVIHFDNHPDWCSFPRTFNCGAWVCRALAMPHVQRVVTLGPCSEDLVRPELQTADLTAISQGRLEVYPWRADPSRVWRKYRDTPCTRQANGHLHWRNLADEPWSAFLDELVERLPKTPLWITIDKDVLGPKEATTNWDQGEMQLAHVIEAVERFARNRRVIGVDVCGEHSEPVFADPFRRALANFDNPPGPSPSPYELTRNAVTNARLIGAFDRIFN